MKLAVIPARGGSKRIPRKNIRAFNGQPIIAYPIKVALASGLFEKVVVSTDDEEIAEIARAYGAEVPFMRPADLSNDLASARSAVHHAREYYQSAGQQVDFTCCIYATVPFLKQELLAQGLDVLLTSGKPYSFSVTEFEYSPFRGFTIDNDCMELVFPEHRFSRSQEMSTMYHDAGQFYWSKVTEDMVDEPLVGADAAPVVIPRYLVQDIDTEDDWIRAELMHDFLVRKGLLA